MTSVAEEPLHLNLDGYEGPLHLLLHLARRRQIDLTRMSMASLATQYINFIEEARALNLEVAASHLAMAAWLVWIKSRLLVPQPTNEEDTEDTDDAEMLAMRLRRLATIRTAAQTLFQRSLLFRDTFPRGQQAEGTTTVRRVRWQASQHGLFAAYADARRAPPQPWTPPPLKIVPLAVARQHMKRLLGSLDTWQDLASCVGGSDASSLASGLTAALEFTREGKIHLKQEGLFAPIHLRDVR